MSDSERKRPSRQQIRKAERDRARTAAAYALRGVVRDHECAVQMTIGHPDRSRLENVRREVRAIIDTGCTHSTVRPDIAASLGLPVVDNASCYVANSREPQRTSVVQATLLLPRQGMEPLPRLARLAVLDGHSEMLFGMDVMQGGVLIVDLVEQFWAWEWRPAR